MAKRFKSEELFRPANTEINLRIRRNKIVLQLILQVNLWHRIRKLVIDDYFPSCRAPLKLNLKVPY